MHAFLLHVSELLQLTSLSFPKESGKQEPTQPNITLHYSDNCQKEYYWDETMLSLQWRRSDDGGKRVSE